LSRPAAVSAQLSFVRLVYYDDGSTRASNPSFFAQRPELTAIARRALQFRIEEASFLMLDGRKILRVEIETMPGAPAAVSVSVAEVVAPFGLTPQELRIATCIAGGLTTPAIAASLDRAPRTVATHIESIFAKTGTRTRSIIATLVVSENALMFPLPLGVELVGDLSRLGALMEQQDASASLRGIEIARRGERRPIALVALLPSTSSQRYNAASMKQGAELAVRHINDRGGINGRAIRYVPTFVDSSELSATAANALANDADGFLLGNFPLEEMSRTLREVASSGAPLLHSMVNPTLSKKVASSMGVLANTFQVCATESAYVAAFLRTLSQLSAEGQWQAPNNRVTLVLRDSTTHSTDLNQLHSDVAASRWTVGSIATVPDLQPVWDNVLDELVARPPAAVFLSIFAEADLEAFLREARRRELEALIYTAWTPAAPDFNGRLGGLADGLLWSTVVGIQESTAASLFKRQYREMFARSPGLGGSGIHFDMVTMLAKAWSSSRRPWDFREVASLLRSTVHHGVAGPYSFSGEGQRALSFPEDIGDPSFAHAHLVYQIQGGVNVLIAPSYLAHRRSSGRPEHDEDGHAPT